MYRRRPLARRAALALAAIALIVGAQHTPAQDTVSPEAPIEDGDPTYLRPTTVCPADPEVLARHLLQDLPSYANRVASRNLDLSRPLTDPVSTVLVASAPDLNPIDLAELGPGDSARPDDPALQQVFFTTLERQFWPDQTVSLQHYHWLFLAQTPEGWYLAMLYSSLGSYPGEQGARPPTPPQESSDGIVGQAVRLWLRDCRAGALFPTTPSSEPAPSAGSTLP